MTLHARLATRPEAITGLIAALAGTVALAAHMMPWYEVAATLDLLGASEGRTVADLSGWQAHPWSWLTPVLALVAVAAGLAAAIDRPFDRGRDLALVAGLGLAMTVVAGSLWFPDVARFDVAGSRLRELATLAGRLPADVDLTFAVRPAPGLWLTLLAAALLVTTALVARARS